MSQPIPIRDNQPQEDELLQFEQVWGPFDPPANYRFEPEFINPPPRPIPPELYQGRYYHKMRMGIIGSFVAGLVLLLCSFFPIVKVWGLYVLPLQYLHWIAGVLLLISAVYWIQYLTTRGPLAYIEEGTPLVARIVALFLRLKLMVNGAPTVYEYVAVLQHRDPQSGEVILSTATHDVNASAKDKLTLSYRVGDYVTAVSLRSNPEKTFRLYGFLDLRPNLGIVPRDQAKSWTVWSLIGGILALFGFFFVLGWNVYAFGKFKPLELTKGHLLPVILGAILLGGPFLGFLSWSMRKTRGKTQQNNQEAAKQGGAVEIPWQPKRGFFGQGIFLGIVLFLGGLLLGGGTMLCWALSVNALYDSSRVKKQPIHIRNAWIKTHSFLFREYTIEYELMGDPAHEKHSILTTPDHIESFGQVPLGFAHLRQGYFGWPWVETITPAIPNAPAAENEKEKGK
jgi:hypothetical protein